MDWKNILKNQRTLMDFGMTAPQGTVNRTNDEQQMKVDMEKHRNRLEQNRGRIKMQDENRKIVDVSEYWTNKLNSVNSLEDWEEYKRNFLKAGNYKSLDQF